VIALGVTLDELQRSPWVTRQGQRPDQPVPFSHKHHVQGLGLQCQYCHVTVEKSSYAGIPPTKTCMNCHAQNLDQRATAGAGARELGDGGNRCPGSRCMTCPITYISARDSCEQRSGCATCHGRVDQMPLMYAQNTLQMEWCLDCIANRRSICGRRAESNNKRVGEAGERQAGLVRGGR